MTTVAKDHHEAFGRIWDAAYRGAKGMPDDRRPRICIPREPTDDDQIIEAALIELDALRALHTVSPGWMWSTDSSEGWEGAAPTREGAIAAAHAAITAPDNIEEFEVVQVANTEVAEGVPLVYIGKVETVPWAALHKGKEP